MQKYRADISELQNDGAIIWRAVWQHGRSLAKINNCRLASLAGDMRACVCVTGEPDTYFSQPAVCRIMGKRVKGYVSNDENGLHFRHGYYN